MSRSVAGGAALTVQLLQMPLLLHEAWREHAETLLREYLLVSLGTFDFEGADGSIRASRDDQPTDSSTVQDPIRVHAAAMDALALLEEQVPDADIDMNPEQLMATATEPRVTTARVHVRMPRASVQHFATLDRALAATVDLVGSGQVMAPKTETEIQAFGRWVCGEVDWQSSGLQPVPWVVDRDSSAPWDVGAVPVHGDVTTSSKAVVAADDTNQIIAISAAAVTLLGYDAAEELVGRPSSRRGSSRRISRVSPCLRGGGRGVLLLGPPSVGREPCSEHALRRVERHPALPFRHPPVAGNPRTCGRSTTSFGH